MKPLRLRQPDGEEFQPPGASRMRGQKAGHAFSMPALQIAHHRPEADIGLRVAVGTGHQARAFGIRLQFTPLVDGTVKKVGD